MSKQLWAIIVMVTILTVVDIYATFFQSQPVEVPSIPVELVRI